MHLVSPCRRWCSMTTDITELARERLKEKFDVWFEREYKHLESSKYTDAVPHIKYGFWTAYQAGGAELVEALEKAQQYAKERDAENQDLMLTVGRLRVEREELESRTVKLPKKNIGWDRDEDDCWNNAIDACTEALTAAGIKVEAE
ncbi:TPA: ead/Ea22-like family protein [Raoultella ornithinolytica]|nr:ead/Ea22-like family protein [Raoultella ornithinolytica]